MRVQNIQIQVLHQLMQSQIQIDSHLCVRLFPIYFTSRCTSHIYSWGGITEMMEISLYDWVYWCLLQWDCAFSILIGIYVHITFRFSADVLDHVVIPNQGHLILHSSQQSWTRLECLGQGHYLSNGCMGFPRPVLLWQPTIVKKSAWW